MDNLFVINIFLSLVVIGYALNNYIYFKNSKKLNKENLLLKESIVNYEKTLKDFYNKISELTSTIETQKEHIQALRRAERRHKYLIKKLNPKNGKKASLQNTQSN
ncbi:MAG: hypothetical protein ACYDG3_13995 [Bacillati bacterium]